MKTKGLTQMVYSRIKKEMGQIVSFILVHANGNCLINPNMCPSELLARLTKAILMYSNACFILFSSNCKMTQLCFGEGKCLFLLLNNFLERNVMFIGGGGQECSEVVVLCRTL